MISFESQLFVFPEWMTGNRNKQYPTSSDETRVYSNLIIVNLIILIGCQIYLNSCWHEASFRGEFKTLLNIYDRVILQK